MEPLNIAMQTSDCPTNSLNLPPRRQIKSHIRYQGQYFDEEIGLHYNRFRYYDPQIGHYINHDPIGLEGGTNSTQYAPNTTQWIDPLGLQGSCGDAPQNVVGSNIKFSQPTISQNFSKNGQINDLIAGLKSGKVKPSDVPAIRVVERNGELVTLDNRRLAAFQAAGVDVPIQRVSLADPAIAKEFAKKFNPVNGGEHIIVTANASGRAAAEAVLRQHGKIK